MNMKLEGDRADDSVADIALGRSGDDVMLTLRLLGNKLTMVLGRTEARRLGERLVEVTALDPEPKPKGGE